MSQAPQADWDVMRVATACEFIVARALNGFESRREFVVDHGHRTAGKSLGEMVTHIFYLACPMVSNPVPLDPAK